MGKIKHVSDAQILATLHLAAREPGKEFALSDNYDNTCTLECNTYDCKDFGRADYILIKGKRSSASVCINHTKCDTPQGTLGELYLECILAISDDSEKLSRFDKQLGKTRFYPVGKYTAGSFWLVHNQTSPYYGCCVVANADGSATVWDDTGQTLASYLDERGLL